MFRKSIFVILIICFCISIVNAQSFDAKKLAVQWEVIENSHKGKPQFLSALTFTNKGKTTLPAQGWKVYFNFVRAIDTNSVTGGHITFINGDLFALSPLSSFTGLKPGETLLVEFVSGDWAVNFTDAPSGFYMVWDNAPEKGISMPELSIKASTEPRQYLRFPEDKIGLITPHIIYEQNKTIKDIPAEQLVKILPTPTSYQETRAIFDLTTEVGIIADESFKTEADYLATELTTLLGKKPIVSTVSSLLRSKKNIYLTKTNVENIEGYILNVKPDNVTIQASSSAGIFYGIQSLKLLMPPSVWSGLQSSISIPTVEVTDAPRFEYRSFFLDVARNFQSKKQILRLLDLMSLYKLNVLHFHLNDDEGWRIEIPALPELTEIGSKRGHNLDGKKSLPPSHGSGPDVNNAAGTGYYSKAEYIEILKYASARHIQVIPEIESPGHARAAIKSMDVRYDRLMAANKKDEAEKYLLRDLEDKSVYRSVQSWNDNIMNVAMPSTYRFLETVVDDLMSIYKEAGAPLQSIHFGGDEVPAGVWEKSPACQALMDSSKTVNSTDDLWYYYFGKVNEMVKRKGLIMYGWEEIGMRKTKLDGKNVNIPNPDFVNDKFRVDVWNNVLGWGAEDLAYQLANSGYKVVLSCVSHIYFDMAYYKSFDEPGYYWGAFVDVDKPFYFIPYDYFKNSKEDKFGNPLDKSIFIGKQRLTDYGKSNIIGIQGLLWSETITTPERMEYMILPKMLGLAERAWAKDPQWAIERDEARAEQLYQQEWSAFVNVLGKRELQRLDNYAGGFNYRIPTPGAIVENGKVVVNMQLPGLTIRYTTDGKEPTAKSNIYTGPITGKGKIKLKAFNTKGRSSRLIEVDNAASLPGANYNGGK
jgi:hexosaminidase